VLLEFFFDSNYLTFLQTRNRSGQETAKGPFTTGSLVKITLSCRGRDSFIWKQTRPGQLTGRSENGLVSGS